MKKYSVILLISICVLALFQSCSCSKDEYVVSSPNKAVKLVLTAHAGVLKYQLQWEDDMMIDTSIISILENTSLSILDAELRSSDTNWEPVWGQFSEVRDNYNEIVLTIDLEGVEGQLFARAYDQGVGFRFVIENLPEGEKAQFFLEHNLPLSDNVYYPAGESEPKGPIAVKDLKDLEKKRINLPLVVEKKDKKYISILDSDLFSAKGFGVLSMEYDTKSQKVVSYNKVKGEQTNITSPWRVIVLGQTAGDLITNTITLNLATPNQLENTDWIKPGKTLWDWRVHSYEAPDGFVYGINTESYKRFIDFAALKDIEYFLIDDSWYTHASKGHFELSEKLDLQEVIRYAAEKEVELILYYDRKHGEYGDKELFPYYQSLGMKGIKYGFMGNDPKFSRQAIEMSAQSELLIDFHDGPVPFTGMQRTYPNAITREYCHAQQDSRRAFTPEAFIKMALINAIQGPLDMNNGNFDITGINSGKREKGPKKAGSYFTTAASEVARTLVIFSGLVCIPDAPEAYLAKADLFEFIQKMPVGKWDESRVLHSSMGEYISTARRHGEEWFIGSVYDRQGGTLDITLDFLEEGKVYQVTYYEDTEETHCKTNPEAYQVRKGTLKKGDIVKAKMAPGGGHAMWIRPVE